MKSIVAVTMVFLACSVFSFIRAGDKITVFAVTEKNDSIEKVIQQLFTELKRSNSWDYKIKDPVEYKGEGFIILKTDQAEKYRISFPSALKKGGPETLFISGNERSVSVISNTALGLQQAIYFYLEQLGYRWLLPGEEWNVVPKLNSAYKKISLLTKPDFEYRWIANGHAYGNSAKIGSDFTTWAEANRLGGSFPVMVGHSYEEIVQRNADMFKKHPEYFGQPVITGTLPGEFKFNVANKELVDFIVKDAVYRYEMQRRTGNPAPMLSMEPSDGGKFCNTPACLAIGTPSDQVYYLSNIVAREFQKKFPGVWIGGYAYNEHILPSKYKLEPNIFVTITNGFNNSKYSTEELLHLWKARASKVGVYDYISVYEWDNDLPGKVTAAKIGLIRNRIKRFYDAGAQVYLAESVMGWVNKGPGQYILSKLVWNQNANIDSLLTDFYNKAFENVAPLVRKVYDSWENYPYAMPSENDMADWYQTINQAYNTATSSIVKKRIDQIKIYLNYLTLYQNLKKDPSRDNLLKTMSYAYRNFEAGNAPFPTLAVLVSLPYYSGYGGEKLGWNDNPVQPWKNDKRPINDAELQESFQQGLRTYKKTQGVVSTPQATGFVKLSSIVTLPQKKYYTTPHAIWYKTEYIIQIGSKSVNNYIELKSDFSAQPPQAKAVQLKIYKFRPGETVTEDEVPLISYEQSKKQVMEKFSLGSLSAGIYRVVIDDRRKMFTLNFSAGIFYSYVASKYQELNTTSAASINTFYFYVPEGVKKFQVNKTHVMLLESPRGRKIEKEKINRDETFFVDVEPGENGLWVINMQAGAFSLEGVPPYVGDSPLTMLVPSYVKK